MPGMVKSDQTGAIDEKARDCGPSRYDDRLWALDRDELARLLNQDLAARDPRRIR